MMKKYRYRYERYRPVFVRGRWYVADMAMSASNCSLKTWLAFATQTGPYEHEGDALMDALCLNQRVPL